jgi:hypothetical protein
MAQVLGSGGWSGASGMRFPIQISLADTAPVASISMPEITAPPQSSRTTRSVGIGRFCRFRGTDGRGARGRAWNRAA